MREFRGGKRLMALVAGAVLVPGCADLATEAERVPAELAIVPDYGRVGEAQPTQLELVVKDQNGDEMPVPGWAQPVWTASGASGAEVGGDGALTAMNSGKVAVSARLAALTAEAHFCVSPGRTQVNAPVIYLTQGAQGRRNETPLIAGRPALLRIFLVGNEAGSFELDVKFTLSKDGDAVFERLLTVPAGMPTEIDESDLRGSVNLEIPGSVLEPGLGMVVELDPNCVAPLAPGSRTRIPDEGVTHLRVVRPQLFRQVFVPTLWRSQRDNRLWNWLDEIDPDSEQMRYARNLLPVWEMEVEVRDTFRTSANLRTGAGWSQWLNEISVLNNSEGRRAYYYGIIGSSPTGLLGLANLSVPWSVGVARDYVYTHEVGHNMSLRHAPCGGAGVPDEEFPYGTGSIGIWGYAVDRKALFDPAVYRDIMGYCFNRIWVSDYHFRRAADHRLDGDGGVDPDGGSGGGLGEMPVVWGSVLDGALKPDPAFVLEGPSVLPGKDGPYRVEGLGADGETMFSLSFAPTPLEHGGGSFVFFVPYDPEWATALDRMVLTGPEGEYAVSRDGEPAVAVLTDPATGLIQAIIRDWDGGPLPGEETANVTITRGIPAGGLR